MTDYDCDKCNNSGVIVYKGTDGFDYGRPCECVEIRKAIRMLKESGISEQFRNVGFREFQTFGDKEVESAKNTAMKYYQGFARNEKKRQNSIMLCGQVGSGKTHLGMAIANNLMEQKIAVVFMPYRNVITSLKQKITDEEAYLNEINKYLNARVLFIDDLLKGKVTDSDINIMFEIINYRYLNYLPIIVTTEKSLGELIRFDEGIGSRIVEMCRGNIVVFNRADLNYRLRGVRV